MKIAVFGAGGVGGYFGGRLAQSGEDVIFIALSAVAQARDVSLPENVVVKTMEFLDALPSAGTASMQRDIMDGKPSELETQTGAVVRLGREAGVETPANDFIYNSLLPMEMRARGQLTF